MPQIYRQNFELCYRTQIQFHCYLANQEIESLFKVKDTSNNPSQVIYHGLCSCGEEVTSEKQREIWRCELLNTVTSNRNPNQRVTYKRTQATHSIGGFYLKRGTLSNERSSRDLPLPKQTTKMFYRPTIPKENKLEQFYSMPARLCYFI